MNDGADLDQYANGLKGRLLFSIAHLRVFLPTIPLPRFTVRYAKRPDRQTDRDIDAYVYTRIRVM